MNSLDKQAGESFPVDEDFWGQRREKTFTKNLTGFVQSVEQEIGAGFVTRGKTKNKKKREGGKDPLFMSVSFSFLNTEDTGQC